MGFAWSPYGPQWACAERAFYLLLVFSRQSQQWLTCSWWCLQQERGTTSMSWRRYQPAKCMSHGVGEPGTVERSVLLDCMRKTCHVCFHREESLICHWKIRKVPYFVSKEYKFAEYSPSFLRVLLRIFVTKSKDDLGGK